MEEGPTLFSDMPWQKREKKQFQQRWTKQTKKHFSKLIHYLLGNPCFVFFPWLKKKTHTKKKQIEYSIVLKVSTLSTRNFWLNPSNLVRMIQKAVYPSAECQAPSAERRVPDNFEQEVSPQNLSWLFFGKIFENWKTNTILFSKMFICLNIESPTF